MTSSAVVLAVSAAYLILSLLVGMWPGRKQTDTAEGFVAAVTGECDGNVLARQSLERARILSPSLLRTVDPPLQSVGDRHVRGVRRLGKRIVFTLDDDLYHYDVASGRAVRSALKMEEERPDPRRAPCPASSSSPSRRSISTWTLGSTR